LPDPQLGQMEPHNKQFPMPGMVGPIPQKQNGSFNPPSLKESDLLTNDLAADRHLSVLHQFATIIQEVSRCDDTTNEPDGIVGMNLLMV